MLNKGFNPQAMDNFVSSGLFQGGVKAVVSTDVVQSLVMLAGVLTIFIQATINVGGFGRAWAIARDRGRIQLFKSVAPAEIDI